MKRIPLKNALLLLLTAAIWGTAFVAQSVGMDYVAPFTFSAARSLIGGAVLLPLFPLLDRLRAGAPAARKTSGGRRTLWLGGILCGLVLFAASNLQQFGIRDTSVGKAGFITAFYIVLVPVLGRFVGRRCPALVWAGVGLALGGLWLLCMGGGAAAVNRGDVLVFLCALLFSVHILVIDRFSPLTDGVRLSCIQFFVCGVLSLVCALLFEQPSAASLWAARGSILYAGMLSSGVAYTLQIVGQKGADPTAASLILSLESVLSALSGWAILGQSLSLRELSGCALVFAAVILVQVTAGRANAPAAGAEKRP